MPKVSFIIPAYNAEATIKSCLSSILLQTESSVEKEIIVINNNSTDKTVSIAKSFDSVIVLHEKKQSRSAARQLGINSTQSEFVAFIDADVVLTPQWLSEMLKVMLNKPQIAGAQGQIEPLIETPWHYIRWHRTRVKTFGTFNHVSAIGPQMIPVINTAASLWRRQGLRAVFNPSIPRAEDIDFTMQTLCMGHSIAGTVRALAYVKWDQGLIKWMKRFFEQARSEKFVYESWNLHLKHGKVQHILHHRLWASLPIYTQFAELMIVFLHFLGWESHALKAEASPKIYHNQSAIFQTFKHDSFYLGEDIRSIFLGEFVALYNIKTFKCFWVPEDEKKWSVPMTEQLLRNKVLISK